MERSENDKWEIGGLLHGLEAVARDPRTARLLNLPRKDSPEKDLADEITETLIPKCKVVIDQMSAQQKSLAGVRDAVYEIFKLVTKPSSKKGDEVKEKLKNVKLDVSRPGQLERVLTMLMLKGFRTPGEGLIDKKSIDHLKGIGAGYLYFDKNNGDITWTSRDNPGYFHKHEYKEIAMDSIMVLLVNAGCPDPAKEKVEPVKMEQEPKLIPVKINVTQVGQLEQALNALSREKYKTYGGDRLDKKLIELWKSDRVGYLYIDSNGDITHSKKDEWQYFEKHEYKNISFKDLMNRLWGDEPSDEKKEPEEVVPAPLEAMKFEVGSEGLAKVAITFLKRLGYRHESRIEDPPSPGDFLVTIPNMMEYRWIDGVDCREQFIKNPARTVSVAELEQMCDDRLPKFEGWRKMDHGYLAIVKVQGGAPKLQLTPSAEHARQEYGRDLIGVSKEPIRW